MIILISSSHLFFHHCCSWVTQEEPWYCLDIQRDRNMSYFILKSLENACTSLEHTSTIIFGIPRIACHPEQSHWLSAQDLTWHGSRVQSFYACWVPPFMKLDTSFWFLSARLLLSKMSSFLFLHILKLVLSQINLNYFIPRVSEEILQVWVAFYLNGESTVLFFPRKQICCNKLFFFFFFQAYVCFVLFKNHSGSFRWKRFMHKFKASPASSVFPQEKQMRKGEWGDPGWTSHEPD